MLPNFIVPDQVIRQNGSGPAIDIGDAAGNVLSVTLGVNRIIEQESLDLTLKGSPDGENWGDKPIAAFPQKFYCGVYTLLVDLKERPDVRYVRAEWKMSRWGRGEPTPLFGVYVFAEQLEQTVLRATG
jgi:hypothetical protein